MCWLMIAAISVSSTQLQSCGLKQQGKTSMGLSECLNASFINQSIRTTNQYGVIMIILFYSKCHRTQLPIIAINNFAEH